jgi:uncharacterized protein
MKRLITNELIAWKNDAGRKPLLLKGVRQSGKTYLLKEFANNNYPDVAYFNFEENPALDGLFKVDSDTGRLIQELGILRNKAIIPGDTLIIFDEIQFSHRALTTLKYFCENAPEYHIACAGSLLGVALCKPSSFPVGKVTMHTLRPMSLYEFVEAHNEQMLLEYLQNLRIDEPPAELFAEKLKGYQKSYTMIGGMPEAVACWLETRDSARVEQIQQEILDAYELDFAKHAPPEDFPKLSMIWHSIPSQLAKENGKFMYGHLRKGARAKDFQDALQWLAHAGLVYQVHKIEKPYIPLSSYGAHNYFKVYSADVGLLRKMAGVPAAALYQDMMPFREFKGALAENFALTELINYTHTIPYYWRSGNTAEVDFICQFDEKIVPVEVKAAANLKSRSLAVYREKFKPPLAVKASYAGPYYKDGLLNIPLYMLWQLKKYVR